MGKTVQIGNKLTEGSIVKLLFSFALPIILGNVIQQLYSMVDLMVIGKYVGSIGTVAVSTGGEISDFMTPVATAFSMSGQIYIAQLSGAGNEKEIKETIGTLITLMFLISIVCTGLSIFFCVPILGLLNCPGEALSDASAYMMITAVGYPFIFGYNAVCGILRGMGESKKPLHFIIVASCVNIVMDVLLVAVIPLGAAGAAIATTLSQFGAFAAAFIFLSRNRKQFDFEWRLSYFRIQKKQLLLLVKLGIPQLARSIFVYFSMMWVNSNVNSYGLVFSATNSVGNKLQKFLNLFVNGVDTASAAMIGQNLGAKKPERAKKTVFCTFGGCLVIATAASALALTVPRQMFSIFTNDPMVIEMGVTYMRIMVMAFYMTAFTGSFQSMVTGSGYVSMGFIIGLMDGVVCRIGFSLLFYYVFQQGAESFWWGTAFSRTIPGLICFAYTMSGKWKTRKLIGEK